ncbi:hypothetical protein [Nocardioides bruguierae]|uniref:hypothetical protein n=1 Tax=Nocardioides bruguierae TaxID=2945102 RepID=UPI0020219906|nr:hypothetical protein [Nocardioides bruguierae]MCL8025294.1 hypothetical protein [Nocardioides bruguierae]
MTGGAPAATGTGVVPGAVGLGPGAADTAAASVGVAAQPEPIAPAPLPPRVEEPGPTRSLPDAAPRPAPEDSASSSDPASDPASGAGPAAEEDEDAPRRPSWYRRLAASRVPVTGWWVLVLGALGCLVATVVPVGPAWLGTLGSLVMTSAYSWALAARTGGRPLVFGTLAALIGGATWWLDEPVLRNGAAVMTAVVAALLGVLVTVPAKSVLDAAREAAIALLVATVGSFAVVGWGPGLSVPRFDYLVLGLSLVGALVLVRGLAAGLHGLGRRGLVAVVSGSVVLVVGVAYAEALRRYGPGAMVSDLLDAVRWTRVHLGAFPRPLETILGVPALAWGCHMRARRRQGWWMCAFGVAATAPVAGALAHARVSLSEAGLSTLYGLVVGLVIGFLVIRLDLALTGPKGGRGSRRAEEAAAVRPEPPRTRPLR